MKLYFAPRTRATRPRWVLEELGIPHEIVRVDLGAKENREPGYLAVNPLGRVPALVDGDVAIFESIAICLYLADRYPERGLAPPVSSPLRGPYYQWLLFCASTLESSIGRWAQHGGEVSDGEREKARARFDEAAELLTRALAAGDYVLGDSFSTVDVIVGSNLNWARRVGLLDGRAVLTDYVDRLLARPAALRAFGE
jgi:glutathione S-transferase